MTQTSSPSLPSVEEESERWTKILGRKPARKPADHNKAKTVATSTNEETGKVTDHKGGIPPNPSLK